MHPFVSGLMADAHREELLRQADQHRLVVQARAVRPRRGSAPWQAAVSQVAEKLRVLAKPAPAAIAGCAPQPACCPA